MVFLKHGRHNEASAKAQNQSKSSMCNWLSWFRWFVWEFWDSELSLVSGISGSICLYLILPCDIAFCVVRLLLAFEKRGVLQETRPFGGRSC